MGPHAQPGRMDERPSLTEGACSLWSASNTAFTAPWRRHHQVSLSNYSGSELAPFQGSNLNSTPLCSSPLPHGLHRGQGEGSRMLG